MLQIVFFSRQLYLSGVTKIVTLFKLVTLISWQILCIPLRYWAVEVLGKIYFCYALFLASFEGCFMSCLCVIILFEILITGNYLMSDTNDSVVAPKPAVKNLGGRPSSFKEEYGDELVEHMKKGGNALSFAVNHGVSEHTFYDWVKSHPKFFQSYIMGRTHLKNYMRDLAEQYLEKDKFGKQLNLSIYNKLMKFHFGKDLHKDTYINVDPTEIINFEGTPIQKMEAVSAALKGGILSLEQYKTLMDGIRIESDVIYNEQIADELAKGGEDA